MIYALMTGDYDSYDIHSAYTDEDEAKAAGAKIEAHNGTSFEVVPITFNVMPEEGQDVWAVVIEGGQVLQCRTVGLATRWHEVRFRDGRLYMQTLARTPEEALKAARDVWDSIHKQARCGRCN